VENVSIRVQLDITGGGEQVGLIHRRRGEASLPQIAAPALAEIHLPGITPMGLAQGRAQAPRIIRHQDQMRGWASGNTPTPPPLPRGTPAPAVRCSWRNPLRRRTPAGGAAGVNTAGAPLARPPHPRRPPRSPPEPAGLQNLLPSKAGREAIRARHEGRCRDDAPEHCPRGQCQTRHGQRLPCQDRAGAGGEGGRRSGRRGTRPDRRRPKPQSDRGGIHFRPRPDPGLGPDAIANVPMAVGARHSTSTV